MTTPLQSLIDTGTKLYLDSVDPAEVDTNLTYGAVGATSNPAIISSIVAGGDLAVDSIKMHEYLMSEGVDKFVKPQRALLALIAKKRQELIPSA